MNPIFKDFIKFLEEKDKGIEQYNLEEGYYWMDRMIIKAFSKEGNIYKILRIKIDENMNISHTKYKRENFEIATWTEVYNLKKYDLNKKVEDSTQDIKDLISRFSDRDMFICHSGGKDSTVLMDIIRKVDMNIPILFNNTTNESADTYKLIKKIENKKMLHPKISFINYCKQENFVPSRLKRSCCGIYKHNLTLDSLEHNKKYLLFMGMRNAESSNRSQYQTVHNFDYYPSDWTCGLVIRKWTELDIWLYILGNKIEFNEIYKKGYSRCGCVICPYRSNFEEQLTKHFFPSQLNRFQEIQKEYFLSRERWIGLNCTLDEFLNKGAWKGGLYRQNPVSEVIKEFAEYKNLDESIAEKYFEKRCAECDKSIRQTEVLAMNLKFLGRDTTGVYCKKHLKDYLNKLTGEKFTNDKWNETVEGFKNVGCELF